MMEDLFTTILILVYNVFFLAGSYFIQLKLGGKFVKNSSQGKKLHTGMMVLNIAIVVVFAGVYQMALQGIVLESLNMELSYFSSLVIMGMINGLLFYIFNKRDLDSLNA